MARSMADRDARAPARVAGSGRQRTPGRVGVVGGLEDLPGAERRQAMTEAGAHALVVARCDFAAATRMAAVDRTARVHAWLAGERDAAGRRGASAAHRDFVAAQGFGQFVRNPAQLV